MVVSEAQDVSLPEGELELLPRPLNRVALPPGPLPPGPRGELGGYRAAVRTGVGCSGTARGVWVDEDRRRVRVCGW